MRPRSPAKTLPIAGTLALLLGSYGWGSLAAGPLYPIPSQQAYPLLAALSVLVAALLGYARWSPQWRRAVLTPGFQRRLRLLDRSFPWVLAAALAVAVADVLITLYAVGRLGLGVEANRHVRALLSQGLLAVWVGEQVAPSLLMAAVYRLLGRGPAGLMARSLVVVFLVVTAAVATRIVASNLLFLSQRGL